MNSPEFAHEQALGAAQARRLSDAGSMFAIASALSSLDETSLVQPAQQADELSDMATFINWANDLCQSDRIVAERHIPLMVYAAYGVTEIPPQ